MAAVVGDVTEDAPFMPDPVVVATVFGITFLAELPDKSLFASLVLSTRYRPLPVWLGVAAAFAVHMAIAVTVGQLLTLLPGRLVDAVVAALFVAGAAYLAVSSFRREGDDRHEMDAARQGGRAPSSLRVAAIGFGVVFLGEWGDITQVTTANLTARYADPVSVGIGAVLGLWAVTALAVTVGAKSIEVVPVRWVQRITAAILLGFGGYSAVQAAI